MCFQLGRRVWEGGRRGGAPSQAGHNTEYKRKIFTLLWLNLTKRGQGRWVGAVHSLTCSRKNISDRVCLLCPCAVFKKKNLPNKYFKEKEMAALTVKLNKILKSYSSCSKDIIVWTLLLALALHILWSPKCPCWLYGYAPSIVCITITGTSNHSLHTVIPDPKCSFTEGKGMAFMVFWLDIRYMQW